MTPTAFLVCWAALLLLFVLILWRLAPGDRRLSLPCPPHEWESVLMDNGTWHLFCSKCGEPPLD